LGDEERVLFARLAVFAGGWTVEAMEAVCNGDGALEVDLLDGLASLVENSLVRQLEEDAAEEPRFGMLETIREYAAEKLAEVGEAEAMRALHFRYFLTLARAAFDHLTGRIDDAGSIDRLKAENGNLAAALRWAIERRDVPGAQRLAAYACLFWGARGFRHEAQVWEEAALSIAPPGEHPAEHGLLLFASGLRSAFSGDRKTGVATMLEGERLLAQAGDSANARVTLLLAAMHMAAAGDTRRAIEHLDRGLTQAREAGDSWAVNFALRGLAHAALADGDHPLARRYAEEAITMLGPHGDRRTLGPTHNVLGDISRLEGQYAEARDHYERAMALTQAGWSGLVPSMQHNLAWSLHGLGDDQAAIDLFTSTARDFQRMGDTRGVAECLVGLGCAASQPEIAVRLFAAGCSLLEAHGMSLSPPNQQQYDRESARVRAALGDKTWEAAWAVGMKLTPEEALDLIRPTAPIAHGLPGEGP
jgi:tetratricopeptide (TPR) repeat protein